MRRFVAIGVALVCAVVAVRLSRTPQTVAPTPSSRAVATSPASPSVPSASPATTSSDNSSIARAFESRASNVRVDGEGVVARVLPDDTQGDRHQRFLVRLASGQSILIVHNIDIAPRVQNLRVGDEVQFEGEYVWNEKGGLVHWTHHDPAARHKSGWIKHAGRTFQ